MGSKLNLIGQRFGSLVVIQEISERKNGQVQWLCQCDCGKKTNVVTGSLRSGNTKSCGCQRNKGLVEYNLKNSEKAKINIGEKFGYLEVIEDLGFKQYYSTGHSRRQYLCKCLKCGQLKKYFQNELKSNSRKSCGCIKSLGEEKITQILTDNKIPFSYNVGLPNIQQDSGYKLRFDFIIYDENNNIKRCIEFDGKQHFEGMQGGIWSNCESLELIQKRDKAKNDYCKKKNIPLIRIPYTKLQTLKLEDLMTDKYLV